jgi:hypothetical protein
MTWHSYKLDQKAQELVLNAKIRDQDSLNQSHKMRSAVAYGLERFWGEHLRFQNSDRDQSKSEYWKAVWDALVETMAETGVTIPNDSVHVDHPNDVLGMSEQLWKVELEDQRVALAVLTQLCDCLVWWTQRYK